MGNGSEEDNTVRIVTQIIIRLDNNIGLNIDHEDKDGRVSYDSEDDDDRMDNGSENNSGRVKLGEMTMKIMITVHNDSEDNGGRVSG